MGHWNLRGLFGTLKFEITFLKHWNLKRFGDIEIWEDFLATQIWNFRFWTLKFEISFFSSYKIKKISFKVMESREPLFEALKYEVSFLKLWTYENFIFGNLKFAISFSRPWNLRTHICKNEIWDLIFETLKFITFVLKVIRFSLQYRT